MGVREIKKYWSYLGPGVAIAATGVGAGDMVAATVAGAKYGYAIIWAAAAGAVLKFVLNEGLARWQLATGTTLLEGWVVHLGRWVQGYFLIYLVLWSAIVGAALISACGLAAHAIFPQISVLAWGAFHSVSACAVVLLGGYEFFERTMKFFIGFMFVSIIGCALWVEPPASTFVRVISDVGLPGGSSKFVLGVIGGVGGSLTLLAYGYWMREKRWIGAAWRNAVRFDLLISYALTGLFGVAVMVLASRVLHSQGVLIEGSHGVLQMADMLSTVLGRIGQWAFLIGFWGAVFTSMLGVWQGVPYLFCDFVGLRRKLPGPEHHQLLSRRSVWYRGFLIWLALPPILLLAWGKPVALIVLYAVIGALFMPFLAGTLLYMNSRIAWVGVAFRNTRTTKVLLFLALLLFGYLCVDEVLNILH